MWSFAYIKNMYDKNHDLIHINPGAAEKKDLSKRTIVLIDIKERNISNIRVVELEIEQINEAY